MHACCFIFLIQSAGLNEDGALFHSYLYVFSTKVTFKVVLFMSKSLNIISQQHIDGLVQKQNLFI